MKNPELFFNLIAINTPKYEDNYVIELNTLC